MLYYITEYNKWPASEVIVPEHQIKKISSKIVAELKIYTIELIDGTSITGHKITTTELINVPARQYLLIDGGDTYHNVDGNMVFEVFNVLAFQCEFKEKDDLFESSRIINCLTSDPYLPLRNGIILDLHLRRILTDEGNQELTKENLISYLKKYTENVNASYDIELNVDGDFYGIGEITLLKSKEENSQ